jgi:hypothetical protein
MAPSCPIARPTGGTVMIFSNVEVFSSYFFEVPFTTICIRKVEACIVVKNLT